MPDITEKKTDIVLDENGNALDKDGNKKKLSADYMSRADVNAIISEFSQHFEEALATLDKVETGASFSEAESALGKLVTVISGGAHIEFAKKNAWIADPAQRSAFLTSGIDQGIADKQFIIDFYKLVVATQDLRAGFSKFLNSCVSDYLFTSYLAIRYERQMKEIVTFDELYDISSAFVEFDSIYNTYNDGKIYESIPVSKSKYSPEENLEMVLDHMDAAIGKKSHLCKFMLCAEKVNPSVLNQLHIFDRETKAFDRFASREDSLQRAIAICAELNDTLGAKYVIVGDGLGDYLTGYRRLLEKLLTVFKTAIKVIETFKTEKTKAPYAIMHYDAYVKDVVSKHMLGSLSDPITNGTNYSAMAQKMIDRCRNLARSVAKSAPA